MPCPDERHEMEKGSKEGEEKKKKKKKKRAPFFRI